MSDFDLKELLKKRILILDGAMGTMLQSKGASEKDFNKGIFAGHPISLKGDNDVLNVTSPELVKAVHTEYLEAGADIIETNTFNSTRISQADYGLEDKVYDLAFAGAKCAREAADRFSTPDKPRFVAGSIGPTSRTLSMSPSVEDPAFRNMTFDELAETCFQEIEGLLDGGADLLLIETCFDTLNAKAAGFAAERAMEKRGRTIPVIVSATIGDASGRMLCGQDPEAFLNTVSHIRGLLAVGFNCGLGAKEMHRYLAELSPITPFFLSAYPNAGLPDESGHYRETPELMAEGMRRFAEEGLVNIAGGCCGTTPAHIRAIAKALEGMAPRQIPAVPPRLRLAGLDPFTADRSKNFINVGERTNVAGSRKFLRLVKEGDMASALRIAREQIENGAAVIDVNMDDALLDSRKSMDRFLRYLASDPDAARVPVMVDSSNWDVVISALKVIQGKAIVNSISLKEGEARFLEKAKDLRKYGAAVLVMAFDEQGQADTLERRISVLSRSYDLLTQKAGIRPEEIVFDPNVFAVATGMPEHDRYALDFIEAVRLLHEKYPLCGISGGISNVSFSFRGNDAVRGAIHTVFLKHAIDAGLSMGIVNAAQLGVYSELDPGLRQAAEEVILAKDPEAPARLIALASATAGSRTEVRQEEETWRKLPVEKRIAAALVRGNDAFVTEDLKEAETLFPEPVAIVEGPLMDGMKEVGQLFGSGKMFLPQVVRSARVMKKFVAELMPRITEKKDSLSRKDGIKVVLATVKGDVHDIGKNIVSVVLQCNSCQVTDLGVMVPADRIADAAEREKADVIGLSGLITPSLNEMVQVIRGLEKRGITSPVLVGGAATSELHTALKMQSDTIPVIHVRDASEAVPAVSALMNPEKRHAYLAEIRKRYRSLAEQAGKQEKNLVSFEDAKKRTVLPACPENPPPAVPGLQVFELGIPALERWIDWEGLIRSWDLPDGKKDGCSCGCSSTLVADAEKILSGSRMFAKCACRILPANSRNGEILIYSSEERRQEDAVIFPTLRQQTENSSFRALSDWIAPEGTPDWIGCFAVSVQNADQEAAEYRKRGDDYSALLTQTLSLRLAEAAAEAVHRKIRRQFWGFERGEEPEISEVMKGHVRGIRPAPGYPILPDHSLKKEIMELLDGEKNCGITLTESFMMQPQASVCAFVIAHPDAVYSAVGPVGPDQQEWYDVRRKH